MNGNTASLQQDAKHSKNIHVTLNSSEKKEKEKVFEQKIPRLTSIRMMGKEKHGERDPWNTILSVKYDGDNVLLYCTG